MLEKDWRRVPAVVVELELLELEIENLLDSLKWGNFSIFIAYGDLFKLTKKKQLAEKRPLSPPSNP